MLTANNVKFLKYKTLFIFEKSETIEGTPLAQLVKCRTFDRKVAGSNLTRSAVLCPSAGHFIFIA